MNEGRLIVADFCDDIRYETGHKYSLMGVYHGEIILSSLPFILPKLAARINAITPMNKPFEKLVYRSFLNETLLNENEISESELAINQKKIIENASPEEKRLVLAMHVNFVPLAIEKESVLRIEVVTEEGIIQGTRITFKMVA